MKVFIKTFDFINWILDIYFFIGMKGLSFVFKGEIVDSFMGSIVFISLDLLVLNSIFAFGFRENKFFLLIFISKQPT